MRPLGRVVAALTRRMPVEMADRVLGIVGEAVYRAPRVRRAELARRQRVRASQGERWFGAEESAAVEALARLIVPTSDDTPGAGEVEVLGRSAGRVVESVVATCARKQRLYARGLLAFDELARRDFGARLVDLSSPQQEALLRFIDSRRRKRLEDDSFRGKLERRWASLTWTLDGSLPAVELCSELMQDVLGAFYTSVVSWIWLGYDGPPMPDGYPNVLEPRPPRRATDRASLRQIAASLAGSETFPAIHLPTKGRTADVIVIGSGAGGAVVAKELAEAGMTVVVLEAGKRYRPHTDYPTDRVDFELAARGTFQPDDPRRDLYTTRGGQEFVFNRTKGVGGSTLQYAAMSPRLHESDFRVRSEDGVADDWPIGYADLEPHYSRVEWELGVSGADGANPFEPPRSAPFPNPPHPFNRASLVIKRGAEVLGLHMGREPVAIPSRDWNGRPACIGAGTCHLGCLVAAKSSMDVTYIARAEATGKVDIRTESTAFRVTTGKDGRARGVLYFDREGSEREVSAKAVVLAGNAVETPRLLLLSSSSRFPHGLANSSGLVGKNFMEHLAVFAYGTFDERVDPWRGIPTGGMIQDYYATRRSNDFARGWTVIVSSNSHWPLAIARRILGWGAEHKREMERVFGHTVCLASIGEQLPSLKNQVTLDPIRRDACGLPVPHLINAPGENERAMIRSISACMSTVLEAAGAREIRCDGRIPGMSSHYLGTCRMGSDPDQSVVDAWGRAHDVPNLFIADSSVFVTGGAVNPALTISALASRTAGGIVRAFDEGSI